MAFTRQSTLCQPTTEQSEALLIQNIHCQWRWLFQRAETYDEMLLFQKSGYTLFTQWFSTQWCTVHKGLVHSGTQWLLKALGSTHHVFIIRDSYTFSFGFALEALRPFLKEVFLYLQFQLVAKFHCKDVECILWVFNNHVLFAILIDENWSKSVSLLVLVNRFRALWKQ